MDLPDAAFSATQSHDANHGPQYARIGASMVSGKSHAWCAKETKDALTVDLTTSYLITGVTTQGRGNWGTDETGQWVTSYSVRVSENGYDWVNMGRFVGNFDRETLCHVRFVEPVLARFVETLCHVRFVEPVLAR